MWSASEPHANIRLGNGSIPHRTAMWSVEGSHGREGALGPDVASDQPRRRDVPAEVTIIDEIDAAHGLHTVTSCFVAAL